MIRLAVAAGLTAVIVALVAVADHRHKRNVAYSVQEAAWYCAHGRPSSCRDVDQEAHEQRWENREFAYRVTFFVVSGSALGLGLIVLRRRHERFA